jgi:hypothetical protein
MCDLWDFFSKWSPELIPEVWPAHHRNYCVFEVIVCASPHFFNYVFNSTGYDWNKGVNYKALLETYRFCGFQATNFGLAVEEINKMVCNILNHINNFVLLCCFLSNLT